MLNAQYAPIRRRLLLGWWMLRPRSRDETCKRCWRPVNPSFTAPDDLWEPVARWGVLCLPCFTRLTAPAQPTHWVLLADQPVIPAKNEATRTPSFIPPTEATVTHWRIILEKAACGPVEGVWSDLSVVIEDMREHLGMTTPARTLSSDGGPADA